MSKRRKVMLIRNIYQPEPWGRKQILFRSGEIVPIIKADNLPASSEIKYWIDLPDPRTGRDNPYGFGLTEDDFVEIKGK